ncbi:hypothetical protein DSO57_1030279 [Entomophthora muscae]|uniref:Uncharacterized protein n=1 Tax=Entomophthora muscae TaxID=34485 RepID=A0ACC2SDR2_9FUNG|nr:hypothetical protein DSO57_1030279 [Entomophthora muscae]
MSMKREAKLSTGATIPMVGLGTWRSEPNKVGEAVKSALKAGYRHIDCAWIYFNEAEVGNAIKGSGIKREDLFITSKLWNSFHHPGRVAAGFNETLKNLQVDYLDLYLIHWPLSHPEGQHGFQKNEDGTPKEETGYTTADTWKALEALVDSGKVKHIGLSNFTQSKIEKVLETARIPPTVLQVELHPYLPQPKLLEYCKSKNVHVTAYSPLGTDGKPKVLDDPKINEIAKRLGATPAQVALAWGQQRGTSVIPKSVNESRIQENFEDVELSKEDMDIISSLGLNHRFADPVKGLFDE